MPTSTLMRTLIGRLLALPDEKQEAYAAAYLEELDDDERWEQLFEAITEQQWKKLGAQMKERIEKEGTISGEAFLGRA